MSPHSEPIHVLHVDDDAGFTELVATFLEREDDRFDVHTTTSVPDALARLADLAVDCVVSDYDMPGETGLDFLETVRERHPDLPFILYTGKGSEEVASDAISTGATDYLQKEQGTSQYDLLANRIRNAVGQYRSTRCADKLGRIRALASAVNQTLVRADSRSAVETGVCELLSDSDPYRFAWIGVLDSETDRIEPRASAGVESGYLDDFVVTADDSPTGRGPAGRAIREGRIVTSQDIAADPEFEPWRGDAVERGYRAAAAIPLRHEETLYGELVVYADRPNAFGSAERALLDELGRDIAYKFHSLETKAELCEERRFIEQALDVLGEIFYVVGVDGRMRRWNRRLSEVTGYSDEDIGGMRATEFFVESDQEAVADAIEETLSTGGVIVEATVLSADGREIPYELSGARLTNSDGDLLGLIGVGRNLTERKQREHELERRNERLTHLASVVSHDLRSPLTSAHGYVELARETPDDEYFERAEASLSRASRIVEDVLWLTRHDQEIGSTTRLDLRGQVESAWRIATGSESGPELVFADELESVVADEDRLRQLLENLLRNASTHAGSDVVVTVGHLDEADGFYVADDGPGIPESKREDVFESGYTTREGGTGYGLAIVAEIADAHGWTVNVTESEAGGARFEVCGVDRRCPSADA